MGANYVQLRLPGIDAPLKPTLMGPGAQSQFQDLMDSYQGLVSGFEVTELGRQWFYDFVLGNYNPLTSRFGWTVTGFTIRRRAGRVTLTVKGWHKGSPSVAFVNGFTAAKAVRNLFVTARSNRLEWKPDIYR